jgi:hypothetical protein
MPRDHKKTNDEKDERDELPQVLEMLEEQQFRHDADHGDKEHRQKDALRDGDAPLARPVISDTSRPGKRS